MKIKPCLLGVALSLVCALGGGLAEETAPFDESLWGRMDGSTATIPLSEKLMEHFLGLAPGQAMGRVTHSTTPVAYVRLIADAKDLWEGEQKDLIWVTQPSPEEMAYADTSGVELEVIPIAKDALVFLNNTTNPVDGLTQQQLLDIYQGKTNRWSELGGQDTGIVAYQREKNSGSQTLFEHLLMEGQPAMEPPEGWRVSTMGYLVDVVAGFENGPGALGYSVFYYVSNMYPNPALRMLAVDGVAPTKETIADGSYPFTTYYFAVLRTDLPQDDPLRELVAFLLTDEGQRLVEEAGYVPLAPLEKEGQ